MSNKEIVKALLTPSHSCRQILIFLYLAFGLLQAESLAEHPNVLFIAVDDLNDWITLLDPEAPIATPNLQRLAARGVTFCRAYAPSPACNPSRTSVLTGVAPYTSGVYGNATDWRRALPTAVTLPRHFMNHGYRVEGAGKLFHHHLAGAYHDADSFHNFLSMPWPPDAPMPPAKLNGLFEYGSANTDWGPWPGRDENAVDVRTVDWCIDRLRQPSTEPLFLACGLFRPHMPFFVPAAWLERYPPDQVVMPETDEHDLEDIPAGGRELMSQAARFFSGMLDGENRIPGSYREAVRCYQASATFADAQIGRLLDALDNSPQMRSTVIVLWSDHGYQLGEKQCWEKFTLWEKATRVPFIIVAPGIAQPGAICERPVSLLDIYPTLVDLCGLPLLEQLEGATLKRWLQIPHAERDRPAIMTYLRGNHAIRSNHWRYIRYADGTEELYDHRNDSQERDNLANDPHYATVLAEHRRWLPTEDAPPAPDKKESG